MKPRFLSALLAVAALAVAAPAQFTATQVVLSGQSAPGGTGGTYSSFSTPALNASGQVAFRATLSGGTSSQGIFAKPSAGVVSAVALAGESAAGTSAGERYSNFGSTVVLNGSGQVAFSSTLISGTSTQGIFTKPSGMSVTAVALQGQTAPGPSGGTYGGSTSPFGTLIALNGAGQVAFGSALTGGTANSGFFAGSAGLVSAVALQGQPAPGTSPSKTYGDIITNTALNLNGSGQTTFFQGSLIPSSPAPISGVFAGSAGSVSAVALQGQLAPSGGTYNGFGSANLNGAGQVVFAAALTSGTATSGLFAGSAGSVSAVALQGQSAPGGSGEVYGSFSSGAVLSGSGQVAFRANLTGGTSTQGIFTKPSGGSVSAVALLGQSAPGTSAGVTYSNFGTGLVLNGSGQVAYTAVLTGTGVTTANDGAVYAGTAGNVQLVVREGDTINTSAGTKTVSTFSLATGSGGEDGRAWSYNDAGIMAMSLTFTDGASGIYLFTPVPEPGTVLGVAAAGLGLARWVRRRRAVG